MEQFIQQAIQEIKEEVQDKKAILGLSGGVDSSVCALLVHEAIGDNLTCIFVDHGLLRKGEREEVEKAFLEEHHMNLIVVDARERFLTKLEGVSDPEKKRKIIGEEFIRVFEEEKNKLSKDYEYLVQGTIYPDILESGGEDGEGLVKSHHNVGGLPEDVDFKIIEPLKTLYKNQVRELGRALGLKDSLVDRQPFPGPGLGVRVLGAITRERLRILQEADAIFREEVEKEGLAGEVWQYLAAIPDFSVTGKRNEERTYSHMIFLRGVTTEDAVEASFYPFSMDFLAKVSKRITDEIPEVNRVLYDITNKPPATIEFE